MSLLNTKSAIKNYLSRLDEPKPNIAYPRNSQGNLGSALSVEARFEADTDDETGAPSVSVPNTTRT